MSAEDGLRSVAGGDPALARSLRDHLHTLADHGSTSAWRELAREVLAGRTDLRDAVRSSAYADCTRDAAQQFREMRRFLTASDEQRLADLAHARLDRLRCAIEEAEGGS